MRLQLHKKSLLPVSFIHSFFWRLPGDNGVSFRASDGDAELHDRSGEAQACGLLDHLDDSGIPASFRQRFPVDGDAVGHASIRLVAQRSMRPRPVSNK